MSNLQVQLKAPNGEQITLPTGLFINNEFVAGSASQKITSVSPRSVLSRQAPAQNKRLGRPYVYDYFTDQNFPVLERTFVP